MMASTSRRPDIDGTTVRGGSQYGDDSFGDASKTIPKFIEKPSPRAAKLAANDVSASDATHLPFVDAEQYLDTKRPFCVRIDAARGGVIGALRELDAELLQGGYASILSKKKPVNWTGRQVSPGEIGIYLRGASPKIITKAGRYPGAPWGNWWGREYIGSFNLTETDFEKHGLVIVQVSQNQAAVCQDPQNQIFVVKNSGFVALAVQGSYKVLDVVDQTHLARTLTDKHTQGVLAQTQDVMMNKKYVAATFLDIPANNIVVLQRENQLFELGPGQHHITQANVKIRGAFTCGEVQYELVADDIYTRDQVPVMMRVYLRWELQHPLLLTRHGYDTPFDALQDKARSILTQILAHLDYSSMAKSRNVGSGISDPSDGEEDVQAAFVDAVRTQATDDLAAVAVEYGILLKDLAIVDRKFKGEIARVMDHLTTRALEAQVESSNLDRENNNRRKKQEGDLRVAQLQNEQRKQAADNDALLAIAAAKGRAEALRVEAEARAQATLVQARAEAEAARITGDADAAIASGFAQGQARARIEVERTRAYGDKTVFVSADMPQLGGAMALSQALDVGRRS